jgi:hypothetical protein
VWGSPRAGPPMEKEGGVRSARSGKDLHAICTYDVIRRTQIPMLIACLGVPPFVGAAWHVAHLAHAAAAGPHAQRTYVSVGAWV